MAALATFGCGFLATGAQALTATPDFRDFGPVNPGTSVSQVVAVANDGEDPLTIDDIVLLGDDVEPFDFGGGTCGIGTVLDPDESCTVTVVFTAPMAEPADYAAYLVVAPAEDDELAIAELVASGADIDGQLLPVGTTRLRGLFIRTGGPFARDWASVTLRAYGRGAAYTGPVSVTGPFVLAANACPRILALGAECEMTVRFTPPYAPPRKSAGEPNPPESAGQLTIGTGSGATTILLRGQHLVSVLPTPPPVARDEVVRQLDRLVRAATRRVRGGPKRALLLPEFDIGSQGILRFRLWARVGKRKLALARTVTTVGPDAGERLSFRLNRRGRALLRGRRPVRIGMRLSFTQLPSRRTDSTVRVGRVLPRAVKPKPR